MIQLSESIIDEALNKINKGLSRYCWIQGRVRSCDAGQDYEFQRNFNAFYKVRRDNAWRRHFYALLESSKTDGITFAHALDILFKETSRVEASFASKLVATLHPEKPLIDRHVLHNFGLRSPSGKNRESRWIACYERLGENYAELMKSAGGLTILRKFDSLFPLAKITDLKKLDLVLWQIR